VLNFKDLSIRHKLTLIILAVSVAVLVLSSVAFIINDLLTLQKTMARNLEVQTRVISANAIVPLMFNDQEETKAVLMALTENEQMVLAQIYKGKKTSEYQPFATYLRLGNKSPALIADSTHYGLTISPKFLQYSQPMFSPNSEQVGTIVLMLDRREMYVRIQRYISIAIAIILASVLIAFLLSARLQRVITKPILTLANLTHRVSLEKNYTLRVESNHQDEISILFKGFNEMLSAIQERDNKLEKHREHLEKVVAERTIELQKLNNKLSYQAYHDALTNLPNRALFIKRVEQAINAAEHHNELLAMLFVDLDRFKYINDTLGHAAGDRLLQEVSSRLLTCTRQPEDTVARLGGDEFTILLRDIKEPSNAGIVAKNILKALTAPLRFRDQEIYVTPSIGISVYPRDGRDVGTLMKNADAGMYTAKKQGRNNFKFYTPNANSASAARLEMENKLRQALEQGEFEVWYQPKVSMKTQEIIGAEALVRWHSPELNLVSPSQFIPLAEDTGLIVPIGEWVLRTACQESKHWQHNGQNPLHISVNLSARQFSKEDLLSSIEYIVNEFDMNPHNLELELTESLIMPNAEDSIETLQALKKQGVQISIDDFGTGYSSLSYLKRFPIDVLKIDRTFIRDVTTDLNNRALVAAIIAMAHNLNIEVVAEGVETQEQLGFLREHQCDYLQGFLFSKPIPAQKFRMLLKNWKNTFEGLYFSE